jgi:hypothetical protein
MLPCGCRVQVYAEILACRTKDVVVHPVCAETASETVSILSSSRCSQRPRATEWPSIKFIHGPEQLLREVKISNLAP